jgi:heptaprenyl diphosphate synthase
MVLVAVLFGNGMMLLYSLAGGGFSMLAMILLKKTDWLSVVGVSIAGGVMHNAGQILMAMLLLDTTELGYYLVVLTVTGILAGIFVGLCSAALIRKIPA